MLLKPAIMASRIFSYKYPIQNTLVKGNNEVWSQISPSNSSTQTRYTSAGNSTLTYTFASNSQALRGHQMFHCFTLTPRDAAGAPISGAGAAAIRNSKQGIQRAFNRLFVRTGSAPIETVENDEATALHYSTLPLTKRNWLNILEGFGNTQIFKSGARKFAQQVWSTIFTQESSIPIFCFPGGLILDYQVADVKNLFTTSDVDHFTIDNPYIRACFITPDPSVTLALTSSVASGRSLWIAAQETRTFRTPGLNSDQLQITNALGAYSSVDSVNHAFYSASARNNQANDRYMSYFDPGLKQWSMTLSEVTNPARGYFQASGGDPETLMVTLLSEVGSIHNFDQVYLDNLYDTDGVTPLDTFPRNHFRFGLNFTSDNESHASGMSLVGSSSGNVVTDCTFTAPITADTVCYTQITCSILVEVTAGLVNVWKVF